MTLTDWPLVGRDEVLEALDRSLSATNLQSVALLGPAGVGKSRLATECLHHAAASGWATERVTGSRAAATIPFGALAPLLPPVADTGGDRAEIIRRAQLSIAELGGDQPLVLLVDDAHLLDDASAVLVHQVAATKAARLVVTVRTGERLPDPIAALWRDGLADRVDVDGLPEADHARLIAAALGGQVDRATLNRVWTASEGNPLLTRELLHAAAEDGSLRQEGGVWRLIRFPVDSPRLGELVEARVGALDSDERRVLELVSVGEPIGLRAVEQLATPEVIERLERRQLVRVNASGRRLDLVVAHPLYAEVARARLPALRARNLRRALAEAVEETGARRREDVLRIATWRLDAGLTTAPAAMFEGARQAFAVHELHLAERLARAAHDAGLGPAAGHLLGQVLFRMNRGDDAEAVLAASAAAATDDATLALVTLTRADNLFWALVRTEEARALLASVRDKVSDPIWRDVLTLGELGYGLVLSGRVAEALPRIAALADHEISFLAVGAGNLQEACLLELGRHEEVVNISRRCYDIQTALGEVPLLFHALLHQAMEALALVEGGWLAAGEELAAAAYHDAVDHGIDRVRGWFGTALGRARMWQGDFEGARTVLRESIPVFERTGQRALATLAVASLAQVEALAGDGTSARQALDDLDQLMVGEVLRGQVDRAEGLAAIADGDVDAALGHLRRGIERSAHTGEIVNEMGCLHDLARFGHATEAAPRLQALAARVQGPMGPLQAAHAAALVADDGNALIEVADGFENIGHVVLAADAAAAASLALARTGDDRSAAGARQRALALAARAPGLRTPSLDGLTTAATPTHLRDAERRVALLAAQGLADKDIADQLFLSVRTVGNYLLRAYRKLGIRTRDELARALRQAGEME